MVSFGHRDKKKDSASNHAAFYPLGVDVFLSPRKIDHIARFVELPALNSSGEVPAILVVNLQVMYLSYLGEIDDMYYLAIELVNIFDVQVLYPLNVSSLNLSSSLNILWQGAASPAY